MEAATWVKLVEMIRSNFKTREKKDWDWRNLYVNFHLKNGSGVDYIAC